MFRNLIGKAIVVAIVPLLLDASRVVAQETKTEEFATPPPAEWTPAKKTAVSWVDGNGGKLIGIAHSLWEYAEPGMLEYRSAKLLADTLEEEGFTVERGVAGMPTAFNPQAANGMVADICFQVTGEEPGDYTLRIADGQCTFHQEASESPTLTIETPSEVWMAISKGELDGQQAFMQQRYKVSGDFTLLMTMDRLFSPA